MSAVSELGAAFWRARSDGTTLGREVTDGLTAQADAYAVQNAAIAVSGLTPIGWKVACTSDAANDLLGTSGPALGHILDELTIGTGDTFSIHTAQGPAVEGEIAFRMGTDLPQRGRPYGRDEVVDAIAECFPAIEIVASRFVGGFAGCGDIRLVADASFNAGWVAGAPVDGWRDLDLAALSVSLTRSDGERGEGTGANVLGHPFTVMEWAANKAAKVAGGLTAGQVISTGTCTGVLPVQPGQAVSGDWGALGTLEVSFNSTG